jgi:chaperonin cofactor prefoldin
MIESQLSAIRSQTETINERLKNLEMKLGSGRRF